MTSPNTPLRRIGTVIGIPAGTPPRVLVTIGGDEDPTHSVPVPYLDSYIPRPFDVVEIHSYGASHVVIGRINSTGQLRTISQGTTNVTNITTTEVELLTTQALVADGNMSFKVDFGFDSWASTVLNDRIAFYLNASLNGGAFTRIDRRNARASLAAVADNGYSLTFTHFLPAAGSWQWRVTAVRLVGTGVLTVYGGDGTGGNAGRMSLAVERWG